MVEVRADALAAGVGEGVAAGDQLHALLEGRRVLVAGQADSVGQVPDGLHHDVGVPDEFAQPVEGDGSDPLDPGDAGDKPATEASCRWT